MGFVVLKGVLLLFILCTCELQDLNVKPLLVDARLNNKQLNFWKKVSKTPYMVTILKFNIVIFCYMLIIYKTDGIMV